MKKLVQMLRSSMTTLLVVVVALPQIRGSTVLTATGGDFTLGQLNTARMRP